MNVNKNKTIIAALLSTSLLIPALSGCSSNSEKTNGGEKSPETSKKFKENDVKAISSSLKTSLNSFTKALNKEDNENIKKTAKNLNTEWLALENNIRESHPLLYTEIEKYLLPLYAGASQDNPDKATLKSLASSLDESLTKLSNAKEAEESNSATLNQAVEQYKKYVNEEASKLVISTQGFTDAVKAKDIQKAKALYAESRAHYERIEPIAESFGDLDPKIDAREGDVDPSEWGGFHRIEKALWNNESLGAMIPVADQLNKDVLSLQEKVKAVQLRPTEVVAGAMELINEAAVSKITGEEERYSRIDLMDLGANVEGSQEIYKNILPALNEKDKELAAKLDAKFKELTQTLNSHKKNGQYVLYTELTQEQIRELSQKLGVLSELMGQTAKILQ
ncbi:iron uptake system protein EfeO [Neobacillus terrae]|uniref:iron uptake system protein EfeO n=1 Tax=Neobacillus terrae TaxID=3034837 RepID=UPI00140C14A9|nr:iron uptake system protein EfeO [Neobacillus terrae]NHM33060.1 Efem/EfeO family lipoprotein [Neobacillus terrae]